MAVSIATPRDTALVASNFRDRLDEALERIGHRSSPVFRDALARAFDETGPDAFPLVAPQLNRKQRRALVRAAWKLVRADPAEAAWALEAATREQFPADVVDDSLDALDLVVGGFDLLYVATGRHAAEFAEELEGERLAA